MKKTELIQIINALPFGELDPEVDVDKVILNAIYMAKDIADYKVFLRFAIIQLTQTLEATEHIDNDEKLKANFY